MLRVGRINSRALQGPIRLPVDKKELMEQVELTYKGWFKVFRETVVPRLIHQPKWFKMEKDVKEGDLIYFQKSESALDSEWTVGQVDQVFPSRDGIIRRVIVKYFNAGEDLPRLSDRSVRRLVKLWSLDEACLFDDLTELQKRVDRVPGLHPGAIQHGDQQHGLHVQQEASDSQLGSDLPCEGGSAGVDAKLEPGSLHQGAVGGDAQGPHCPSAVMSAGGSEGFISPLTSVTGYYVGPGIPRYIAGPTYATVDGFEVDLAALSVSCELRPLHVQQLGDAVDVPTVDDVEVQAANLDTLHNVMVSTGFYLA